MALGSEPITIYWARPDGTHVDLSPFAKSMSIAMSDLLDTMPQLRSVLKQPEPEHAADCPHAPGTPEHGQWIRDYVIARQRPGTQAHADAKADADERLSALKARTVAPNRTFADGRTADELTAWLERPATPSIVINVPKHVDMEQLKQQLTNAIKAHRVRQ